MGSLQIKFIFLIALSLAALACTPMYTPGYGELSESLSVSVPAPVPVPEAPTYDNTGAISSDIRRLSNAEIDNSLALILQDQTKPAAKTITGEISQPYDNVASLQSPSQSLIGALEILSADVSSRLLADTARKNAVVGCANSNATNSTCMRTFITRVGRLLFRRALSTAEINALVTLAMGEAGRAGTFDAGVGMALQALLQDPRFLYRLTEASTVSSRSLKMASKLSFALWGSGPDENLLNLAEAGQLGTREQVRAVAQTMLASPRAAAQAQRFHGLWLRYANLGVEGNLLTAMHAEVNAMVTRVLFTEARPWRDLLTIDTTTVTAPVAAIYGINTFGTAPVAMPAGRKGIIGTPAFLAVASKFNDTSPTQRGLFIREKLLCQTIPPPPPTVNADAPPPSVGGSNCKVDRYKAHRQAGTSCAACHSMTDPVGFGLERYNKVGKFRQFDELPDGGSDPNCPLDGNGEITGVGIFNGPAQLSDLLAQSASVERCLVKNALSFATGRELSDLQDGANVESVRAAFKGGSYQQLMLSLVTSNSFFGKD